MDTGKLTTEGLIEALKARAARHRELSEKYEATKGFYVKMALQCEAEAHALEDALIQETLKSDPFAAAMSAAGAAEIRLGRRDRAENGRQVAPRCTARAGWPYQDQKAEPAQARRWPF